MDDSSKNFNILIHPNGTSTLVDEENGQSMHSRIGPTLEANQVYAEPARVEEALDGVDHEHVLYDVGMGTGANVISTLERIRQVPSARGLLSVYSFESKPAGLRTTLTNLESFPDLRGWEPQLREVLEKSESTFTLGEVKIQWRLLIGDFYSRMKEAPSPDTIYFDFYSPKVVPELWSLSRFTALREKIGGKPARLFTYSAATPVRLHLFAAGFFVGAGASTRAKNETTIATTRFELLEHPLPEGWLRKLTVSDLITGPSFAEARALAVANPHWAMASGLRS